ncbi:MAG: LptA/OstA family protein [Rhodospirillales bacterium]
MRRAFAIAVAAAALAAHAAWAQQALPGGGSRDAPIEVTARDGIEWRQQEQVYIARGDAKAVQGDLTVNADTLSAYYTRTAQGATEIGRLEAFGNVRITSGGRIATGARGVYDAAQRVFVLTGRPRLTGEDQSVVARDSLEYWVDRRMAVARGDAVATARGRTLKADVITAWFEEGQNGQSRLTRADAVNNVVIQTEAETVRGDRGTYDAATGRARLTGDVSITRGPNRMVGGVADVDLENGTARLAGQGSGGVRGVIVPNSVDAGRPAQGG